MAIHVLDQEVFFRSSIPIADQQRLLPVPEARSVAQGDTIFLRDPEGQMTWVGDVLTVTRAARPNSWNGEAEPEMQAHALLGWLARIHPGVLPPGRAKLQSRWVTLNSRTLQTALPWYEQGVLVYHATVHMVEGVITPAELRDAEAIGCVQQHVSGHWVIPHGEARKRFLVQVRGIPMTCGLCGTAIPTFEEVTQDHIVPVSQGGPDVLANVQLAHRACNELKGNALPEQYPPFFAPPRPGGWQFRSRNGYRNGRRGRGRDGRSAPRPLPALPNPLPPAAAVVPPDSVAAAPMAPVAAAPAASAQHAAPSPQEAQAMRITLPAPPDGLVAKPSGETAEEAGQPAVGRSSGRRGGRRRSGQRGRRRTATPQEAALAADPAGEPEAAKLDVAPVAASAEEGTGVATAADRTPKSEPAGVKEAAAGSGAAAEGAKEAPAPADGQPTEADEAWLRELREAGWSRLVHEAARPDWSARTAVLRSLTQLRRNHVSAALSEGELVVEQTGEKGSFRLLRWKEQWVLVEERNGRRNCYQVEMLHALSPAAYTWYLSRFGRKTPLIVAASLQQLWKQGKQHGDGRVIARKGDLAIQIRVEEDRLLECSELGSDVSEVA